MKAYLVAATALTGGIEEFLRDRDLSWIKGDEATDAERTVEAAGRVCYMSFGARQHRTTTATYIANLIAQGHDSVLEHATFTVLVDGVTRALSHQLVRHRVGFSYSQLSQQYTDESSAEFECPSLVSDDSSLVKDWTAWVAQTRSLYARLHSSAQRMASVNGLDRKEHLRLARSIARLVLPNATHTTLMITGNARAWRNLMRSRGNIQGDVEMREYCVAVHNLLVKVAQHLFGDFNVSEDSLGRFLRTQSQ